MVFNFFWFFTNNFVYYVYYVSMGKVLRGRGLLILLVCLKVLCRWYVKWSVCVGVSGVVVACWLFYDG